MNKFRQIISSFLAMSLIISSSYTALAEVISSAGEGGSSAVYTEVFGAEGSVNKFVTNYNETYKTKTSIEGYLKEDGDYAGKISAVRQGTSNNYADVRKVFGTNVVEDYFSITYDINFLSYDGTSDNSSVIVKLSTRNNKREGGSIWGYGTNLFANGSSADKVKVLSASNGAELDTNKWYKVKHYFDGVAHKETMTVTDPETDDTIASIERSIHNDFYAIEMFSFSVCQPAEFLLDNVCVNSEAVSISGFDEQYTTTDDISFNASLPAGFGVASLYANDEEIGTIVEENTSFYDIVITAGTLPEGDYDIRVDAYYDGALQSASASFRISDELVVIAPKPDDSVLDGELFIAATAPKNMTVFATIDATNTIELVPDETDPGFYSAIADVSEGYSMGSHKVIISAQKPDGSVMSAETGFSLNYKVLSKEYYQDFNLLATVGEIDDDTKKGTMGKVGFTFGNETGADFTVVPGPSGEDGDVAAHIQISTDKQLTASAPFIRCANFVNYNEGVTEFEFDIKLNRASNTQIRLTNMYLWSGAILFLVDGGKWAGTSVPATTEWTHIKYITDADKKVISMEIDGVLAVDKAPYGNRTEYKNTQFDLTPLQLGAVAEGTAHTGFAIDNFSAVNYKVYRGITDVSYVKDENLTLVTEDTKVPHNADAIVVNIPNGLYQKSIDGNVELYTDAGEEIPLSSVSYSATDKTLTLVPKDKFLAGRNHTVKLSPSLKYEDETPFGIEYSYKFNVSGYPIDTVAVFASNGEQIHSSADLTSGSRVYADITATNTSALEAKMVYVFTLRENNRIVSMKAKTVEFADGEEEKNIRIYLDEIDTDGKYELCLMSLNSYTDSSAAADYIKLK